MPRRPHILQITTHDSGCHLGCYGHGALHTPCIDALAADGCRLSHYFAAVPICSASRATQLTGLYPQRHGLLDLVSFGWRLRNESDHMARRLKDVGYRTLLFGTQHEVVRSDLPRLQFETAVDANESAGAIAESVARFLQSDARSDTPFYAQIGFIQTHTPFERGGVRPDTSRGVEVPPYLADTEGVRTAMSAFQGAICHVDEAVGRILDALRASGLEDDTLIVFTTDHGIEMPRAKWFLYDPGIAIGMVLRYPRGGILGGRVCDLLLGNVDYLPTVFDLAGLDVPAGLDGRSFAGALRGESAGPVREEVFALYHKNQTRCIRTRQHKLIRHFDSASDYRRLPVRIEEAMDKRVIPRVELFDLASDPREFENLAERPEWAQVRADLDRRLWSWLERVGDPILDGPVRSPAYDAAMRDYADWRS